MRTSLRAGEVVDADCVVGREETVEDMFLRLLICTFEVTELTTDADFNVDIALFGWIWDGLLSAFVNAVVLKIDAMDD